MDDKETIIQRIFSLFSQSKKTQEDVADEMNICRNTFCNIIYGKTQNIYKYIPDLARVFDVSEDYILHGGKGEKTDSDAVLRASGNEHEQIEALKNAYEEQIAELQRQLKEKDDSLVKAINTINTLVAKQEKND